MFLLDLHLWNIVAGSLMGGALAILGAHLATRHRAMQTLCVGQGALVGVLVGLGTFGFAHHMPLIMAFVFSLITFWLCEHIVHRRQASKNAFFAFLFASLLAGAYLISSLFPALEQHMTQVYFGDLATLTSEDSRLTFSVALLGLFYLAARWKEITRQSFELAIFGQEIGVSRAKAFNIIAFILLCFAIQYVGFLFTMTCLFLPTVLMSFSSVRGVSAHLFLCFALASTSTVTGFILSLYLGRFPTVPTIAYVMLVMALCFLAIEKTLTSFFIKKPGAQAG